MLCELQYFLKTPQDSSVAEGDRAVLECQVGNLQGRVQWTKDGLTLGMLIKLFLLFFSSQFYKKEVYVKRFKN